MSLDPAVFTGLIDGGRICSLACERDYEEAKAQAENAEGDSDETEADAW